MEDKMRANGQNSNEEDQNDQSRGCSKSSAIEHCRTGKSNRTNFVKDEQAGCKGSGWRKVNPAKQGREGASPSERNLRIGSVKNDLFFPHVLVAGLKDRFAYLKEFLGTLIREKQHDNEIVCETWASIQPACFER